MVSCLGSLVQPCCGEGVALQTDIAGVCGEHSPCSGHTGFAPLTGVCFPRLHCSGSRLLSRERALRCVRFQFLDIPQKRRLSWACILCLPCRRSSGSQELHGREAPTPGAARLLPSAVPACRVHVPCICSWELASSHDPPGRCRPSRISGSLWLETGDLFAVW